MIHPVVLLGGVVKRSSKSTWINFHGFGSDCDNGTVSCAHEFLESFKSSDFFSLFTARFVCEVL